MTALVGPDPIDEIVKCLHILIAGSSAAVVTAYLYPALRDIRRHPVESRFMLGSVAIAASQLLAFWPLAASYILQGVHPVPVPGLPDWFRLAYLITEHAALVERWAEAEPSRFLQRLLVGSIVSLVVVTVVLVYLPAPDR